MSICYRHSPILSISYSFSFQDNIIDLFEDCRDEMMKLRRQARVDKETIVKLMKEAKTYRLETIHYNLSWELDQVEIIKLKARLAELEKTGEEARIRNEEREKERPEAIGL